MAYLSITSNSHMFVYVKSQACTEVRARLEGVPANHVLGTNLRSHRATIPSWIFLPRWRTSLS